MSLKLYQGLKFRPLAAMFAYSEVAVEIWHQILLAVIDMPYVLDTLVPREDQWRNSARYHDLKTYDESECQRKLLRLVCRSWRDFADGYKYRWIAYISESMDSRGPRDMDALEARRFIAANSTRPAAAGITSKPRRILLQVTSDEEMEIFRTMISHCSSKVTTLFVQCVNGYEDQIFEYMIGQSSKLPMVRCLELPLSRNHPTPLRMVSAAFQNLYSLEIKTNGPYILKDGDRLTLPDLEALVFDISGLPATSLQKWDLRGLTRLDTAIGRTAQDCAQVTLEPIRSFGANLTFLNLYKVYTPMCLPVEFWTWCPHLTELLIFLSWIYLDAPVPAGHPLKYLVHLPHCDTLSNRLIEGSRDIERPVVLHSLQFLPPRLEFFIIWERWSVYVSRLVKHEFYRQLGWENILRRMNELCAQRFIRVEDGKGVALEDFLISEEAASMNEGLD